MADITIFNLNDLTVTNSTYLPVTDGTNTGKALYRPIPIGGIIMWSGSIANIPTGWALCNGQTVNSQITPDLRDRFIVGAGKTYTVSEVGGLSAVQLTVSEMPSHSHTVPSGAAGTKGTYGAGTGYATTNAQSTDSKGEDKAHENRPPYYALAYIMRVY